VGNTTCLACHDGRSAPDKREFRQGPHAGIACEDCHGPGLAHVRAGGRGGLFIDNPGRSPFDATPELCARCHADAVAGHAQTAHFAEGVASCNTCHDVHRRGGMTFSTPNRTPLDNTGFARLCGDCHRTQTEQFLASDHAELNVATCGACHNPHRARTFTAPPENNQLCQQCHASFFLGLGTVQAVDQHTGAFHPVDPEGSGASRCVSCHMVPLRRNNQAGGAHDHTFRTVPPSVSNQMIAAGQAPRPNSCAGIMGCHDAAVPGSGTPFSVDRLEDNEFLQTRYDEIGTIPGRLLP
jgi:predicted CXXCH cytochrome family protein